MFTAVIHLYTIGLERCLYRKLYRVILQPAKMNEFTNMMKQKLTLLLFAAAFSLPVFSQPTHVVIDPEKKYKDAKELFVKEQYALAYPLLAKLKTM